MHSKNIIWNSLQHKMVSFSVNCENNFGLTHSYQEDHSWFSLIWFFNHRLELALKDVLKEFITPFDESLRHLCYLYQGCSKKFRESNNLYTHIKDQYQMCGRNTDPQRLQTRDGLITAFKLCKRLLINLVCFRRI